MNNLQKVAIRQNALYLPHTDITAEFTPPSAETMRWVTTLYRHGFTVSEPLLRALNQASQQVKDEIVETLEEIFGTGLNWAPLIKNWKTPTKETALDHWVTALWNYFGIQSSLGYTLPCGHIIPPDTFPIERYNGCPFCGTPFEFEAAEAAQRGSKLKFLNLWTQSDAVAYLNSLLSANIPLDATQIDSLNILLDHFDWDKTIRINMKETLMLVVDKLIAHNKGRECTAYLTTPTDILRYLWYKKNGLLQIVEPKVLIRQTQRNSRHLCATLNQSKQAAQYSKKN